MNRIDARFAELKQQGRAALVPYITAGDPDANTTLKLMHGLVRAGADVLELGVPFSDPMADGPTIQLACERALAKGMTLRGALDIVRRFREQDQQTPLVLMGYLNPVEAYGSEAFCRDAAAAGVDGVLSVDLAVEEADSLAPQLCAHGLAPIFLVAPTTSEERVRRMGEHGRGYLYYVSLKGVTGSAELDIPAVAQRLDALAASADLPICVGFGIRTPEQAAAVSRVAQGVVVGSALVDLIAEHAGDAEALEHAIFETAKGLADAIRGESHA